MMLMTITMTKIVVIAQKKGRIILASNASYMDNA